MAASLERRDDDAVALFINGDLQFDSSDEKTYHEALALPALALAARRIQSPLKVLVIGGGDGLIAREMFKSSRVASLDLVDYDPEILTIGQKDLSSINLGSLSDPRITIHVHDAWDFVDQALQRTASYDVIVSDLTVAENAMEARFHSVEWYSKLARLLSTEGVLAVNGVSPQATPQAYWCIYNSMLKASLQTRPYHINLPSFAAKGYGDDWGFFVASQSLITAGELEADLSLATPRHFLQDGSDLLRLFIFPEELFAYQPKALPALAGSDILIHYFNNATPLTALSGAVRYTFALDALDSKNIVVPEPDAGTHILPPELCTALAKTIHSSESYDNTRPEGVQLFLNEVLALMPSLQRDQTAALIADFLQAPARFLHAIDLPALITRLLRRAAELPSRLVSELKLLQSKMAEWAHDPENLLDLGHRAFSVLILAIVVGNLLYPDAVYAKAGHGAHGRGYHGGAYVGGGYGTSYTNRRYVNGTKKGPMGPGPNDAAVKRMQKQGSLPVDNHLSDAECIDESGNIYPSRHYRTAQTVSPANAVFRLSPDADILASGYVAMPLTDSAYLLVMPHATHVIQQQSGHCVMSLHNDPELLMGTTEEISRQLAQLTDSTVQSAATEPAAGLAEHSLDAWQKAVHYLSLANGAFKNAAANAPAQLNEAAGARGPVLPSVYVTADGKHLAIKREGGQLAYLDGQNWYADQGSTTLNEPYPVQFRSETVAYLEKELRDTTATANMLRADKHELSAHLDMLTSERQNYEASQDNLVTFGTHQLPRAQAIAMTLLALRKTELHMRELDKQINDLPESVADVQLALKIIASERTV